MEKLLISACLMGYDCRYKGDNCKLENLAKLKEKYILIPVCPEQLGGLSTPRLPGERVENKVLASNGADITEEYALGADIAVDIAHKNGVKRCIMKANSPSCGKGIIYDGTFSGHKIPGNGVTVEKLINDGFIVYTENEIDKLL